jgi:hypothetical protein
LNEFFAKFRLYTLFPAFFDQSTHGALATQINSPAAVLQARRTGRARQPRKEDGEESGRSYGVNLHYLTFRDIRDLIGRAGKMGFSYRSVSDSRPFRDAYRSYKRTGVRQMKVLDPSYLLGVMGMVRNQDPADAQIVRRQVQEQLRQQINPKANQAANLDQTGGVEPVQEADG